MSSSVIPDQSKRSTRTLLSVKDATVRYGGVTALSQLTFSVNEGEICALIGPNGAGKTTAFNAISRLVQLNSGSIAMSDKDLTGLRPDQICRAGIMRTFQNLALWPNMTVIENVMVGAHHMGKQGFISSTLRLRTHKEEVALESVAMEALARLGIGDLANTKCCSHPYGTLKRIELARALAGSPKLLLLDEPASGLTQGEVTELRDLIIRLREETDVTVLLVEHHMQLVMTIADWIVALDFGKKLVEGTADFVQNNAELAEAYLGRRTKRVGA